MACTEVRAARRVTYEDVEVCELSEPMVSAIIRSENRECSYQRRLRHRQRDGALGHVCAKAAPSSRAVRELLSSSKGVSKSRKRVPDPKHGTPEVRNKKGESVGRGGCDGEIVEELLVLSEVKELDHLSM